MADPALGAKQICPNCSAKFYDLNKRPAHCPKCAYEFDPEEAVKSRRIRARAVTPDYETDEEVEDQVKGGEEEDMDDESEIPAIDAAVNEPMLGGDDEDSDDDEGGRSADTVDVDLEDDVDLDDDADDVPFIEDEDEDFGDEIDGLGPDEGDEDR